MRQDTGLRLAVGSFIEEQLNRVQILQFDVESGMLLTDERASFPHPFPPTHLEFMPDRSTSPPDLLATSSDVVRLWKISESGTVLDSTLKDSQMTGVRSQSAVTCFDWNAMDVTSLLSGSTDGILTVWNVEARMVTSRLKAHHGDVLDCQWGAVDVVASCSSDSSIRLFDLRDQEHSTVLYENPSKAPIVRIDWSTTDPKYIALTTTGPQVCVVDIRYPKTPVVVLHRHKGTCNAVSWSPHTMGYLCTAGDDQQALIWDLNGLLVGEDRMKNEFDIDPVLAYNAGAEISQMCWNFDSPEWLAICCRNVTRVLRV